MWWRLLGRFQKKGPHVMLYLDGLQVTQPIQEPIAARLYPKVDHASPLSFSDHPQTYPSAVPNLAGASLTPHFARVNSTPFCKRRPWGLRTFWHVYCAHISKVGIAQNRTAHLLPTRVNCRLKTTNRPVPPKDLQHPSQVTNLSDNDCYKPRFAQLPAPSYSIVASTTLEAVYWVLVRTRISN